MRLLLIMTCGLLSTAVLAETVMIEASQDNTLYGSSQGAVSNGAGWFLFAGATQSEGLRRAVLAFKDLSAIPEGATIDSAKLHLSITKKASGATNVRVLRLQSDWGEGTSNAGSPGGKGTAATMGDATWNHRFFDNITWNNPGGDFSGTVSAEMMMDANGRYTFNSNTALVADVQDWLDNPAGNFGWILLANEDAVSARRFNSSEHTNANTHPILEVEYTVEDTGPTPVPDSNWSGPWFDPTLEGEGYLIYQTPVGWLIYYFGYSADNMRLWLISNIVDIEDLQFGQAYKFPMLVGEPGSFGMPTPSEELEEWGTLDVVLDDCVNGIFTLDGVDGLKVSEVQKVVGVEGTDCAVE